MTQINQLTIIGTGLLGASVGLAAKQTGFAKKVAGVSRNLQSAEKAASVGAIDIPYDKISDSLAEADLAVIAVLTGGCIDSQISGDGTKVKHADIPIQVQ